MRRLSLTEVFIVEDVLGDMFRMAEAAVPFETGGLLVGPRTADAVWIAHAVELKMERPSATRYSIAAGATYEAVDTVRHSDTRCGYVGDWHTHPADAGPSEVDVSSLRASAEESGGAHRLIAVVQRRSGGWRLGLWAMDRSRQPAQVPFHITGPVPDDCSANFRPIPTVDD